MSVPGWVCSTLGLVVAILGGLGMGLAIIATERWMVIAMGLGGLLLGGSGIGLVLIGAIVGSGRREP